MQNPFDFNSNDVEGRSGILDEPVIGKAQVAEFAAADRPDPRDDTKTWDSLSVTFKFVEGPKKGMEFRHTEYGPNSAIPSFEEAERNPGLMVTLGPNTMPAIDALKKVASLYKRVAHLLHPWLGSEEATALVQRHTPIKVRPVEAWRTLRAEIEERVAQIEDFKTKVVTIKVVPNHNGTKLTFPGYAGFISVDTPLTYSRDEQQQIVDFKAMAQSTPTDMGGDGAQGTSIPAPQRASF